MFSLQQWVPALAFLVSYAISSALVLIYLWWEDVNVHVKPGFSELLGLPRPTTLKTHKMHKDDAELLQDTSAASGPA